MPASLRPLRHRNYALLFASNFISNAGSWMQTIGVGAYVTAETQQKAWAGIAALAAFFPIGILGPVGGAIADRVDRRRFLMAANVVEGLIATLLAWLVATGRASAGTVTAVVFVGGCSTALRLPFMQAMTPDLVPREDIVAAAALGSAQYNLGRVLGPTVAGATIVAWGIEWVFFVNAVSFLAVVGALLLVRLPHQVAVVDTARMWSRIRDGARVAWAEPGCRAAIGLLALAAMCAAPFIALVPARALELTGSGDEEVVARVSSYLTTAQGIGAVIGAVAIAEIATRIGRSRVLRWNLPLTCVAVVVYAHAPSVATATVAMGLLGSVYIGILSGLGSTVQLRAPAEYRGRVLSIHLVALGAVYPVGGVLQGFLADRIGLATTTTIFAAVMLAALAYLLLRRGHVFDALGDPPDATPPTLVTGSTVTVDPVTKVR